MATGRTTRDPIIYPKRLMMVIAAAGTISCSSDALSMRVIIENHSKITGHEKLHFEEPILPEPSPFCYQVSMNAPVPPTFLNKMQ